MPFTVPYGDFEITVDFNNFKITVFPNINDTPVEPTQEKAGNASDLIAKYNQVMVFLDSAFTDISFRLQRAERINQGIIASVNNFQSKITALQSAVSALTSSGGSGSALTLSQDTTWYVDGTSGSDDNLGTAFDSPFKTINKASQIAASYKNPSNYRRNILVNAAYYNECVLTSFEPQNENDFITISGNVNLDFQSLNNCLIGRATGIQLYGKGNYLIERFTIGNSTDSEGAMATSLKVSEGTIKFRNLYFGNYSGNHIEAQNGATVKIIGDYYIGADAQNHIYIDNHSSCFIRVEDRDEYAIISLIGEDNSINFNNFIVVSTFSTCTLSGYQLNGVAGLGRKYYVQKGGMLIGGGLDKFYGDQVGITETGGQVYSY